MANSGAMAVLAFDALVRSTPIGLDLVLVALGARVLALILDGELHPLLDISLTIIIVGKTVTVNPKVTRDQE